MKFLTTFSVVQYQTFAERLISTFLTNSTCCLYVYLTRQDYQTLRSRLSAAERTGRVIVRFFDSAFFVLLERIKTQETVLRTDASFREDCARFLWKVAAICDAVQREAAEALCWIDADCVVKKKFARIIELMNPLSGEACRYWGRAALGVNAETGLISFNPAHCGSHLIVERMRALYETGAVFDLKEWHDAYVFTAVIASRRDCLDLSERLQIKSANPIFCADKGQGIVHLKGDRKRSGVTMRDRIKLWIGL